MTDTYRDPCVFFITHADVDIDPKIPVPDWRLSRRGVERHKAFNGHGFVRDISAIYCSGERKAIDGAEILAEAVGLAFHIRERLGENDRSATGYLPREEFGKTADLFFANPTQSIRGWERAIDAQRRIVDAVRDIVGGDQSTGHIAIVSHGGVGTLLLCDLRQVSIAREGDQPQEANGGNYFAFTRRDRTLLHGWRNISTV